MIPVDVAAAPPSSVVVRVPEVVTTAADGLPQVLHAGRVRLVLPVWAAPNATAERAWLQVGSTSCTPVDLRPGAVVRVACAAVSAAGSTVSVRVLTDRGIVATWQHTSR